MVFFPMGYLFRAMGGVPVTVETDIGNPANG